MKIRFKLVDSLICVTIGVVIGLIAAVVTYKSAVDPKIFESPREKAPLFYKA